MPGKAKSKNSAAAAAMPEVIPPASGQDESAGVQPKPSKPVTKAKPGKQSRAEPKSNPAPAQAAAKQKAGPKKPAAASTEGAPSKQVKPKAEPEKKPAEAKKVKGKGGQEKGGVVEAKSANDSKVPGKGPKPSAEKPGPKPSTEKPGPKPGAEKPGPKPRTEKPGPKPSTEKPNAEGLSPAAEAVAAEQAGPSVPKKRQFHVQWIPYDRRRGDSTRTTMNVIWVRTTMETEAGQ